MILGPERRGVLLPGSGGIDARRRVMGWLLLAALLGAVLVGAATFDPVGRGTDGVPPGDAVTLVMQADSLARDFDLTYGADDYARFEDTWGRAPEGLRLRSRDAGEHVTYDLPVPAALALAPVVRFAPVRGVVIANALLLALAALAAARVLERRLGPGAPVWVAGFLFASVTFTYVFRIGLDLFTLAAVVWAFALAYAGEGTPARQLTEVYGGMLPGEESGRGVWRWLGVGALLALAVATHPFYLVLALPLALAPPRGRRRLGAAALLGALVAVLALSGLAGHAAGDDWLPWSKGGRVFSSETGFPAVDRPVSAWPEEGPAAGVEGVAAWLPEPLPVPRTEQIADLGLWGWNLLFLLVGRTSGLVPYFLPALLVLVALPAGRRGGGGRGRWAIPWAVALGLALFLLVRPFDVSGAGAGVANHRFLPLYGALWFAAARPVRAAWVLAAALVAAPYLYPSWLAPRTVAAPSELAAGRYVSPVAARLLPHESTQRDVPGTREVQHGVLWIRLLSEGVTAEGSRLRIDTAEGAELLVASPVPLGGLRLTFGPGAPTQVELSGVELERTTLTPSGGVVLDLAFDAPTRRHPLSWTRGEVSLYRFGVRFPSPEDGAAAGRDLPLEIVPLYQDEG